MTDIKQAIELLERMTAEPAPGEDARLDADELDAVLFVLRLLKGKEPECGMWEYDPPHDYARRFGKWQFLSGGNYKCNRCQSSALYKTNYCPCCGALMTSEVTK